MLAVFDVSWYPNCRRYGPHPQRTLWWKGIKGSVRVSHLKTSVEVNAGGRAEKANFFRGIPVPAPEKT